MGGVGGLAVLDFKPQWGGEEVGYLALAVWNGDSA